MTNALSARLCKLAVMAASVLALGATSPVFGQPVPISSDGAVSAPPMEIPSSALMSPEGNASRVEHIMAERSLQGLTTDQANAKTFGARLERSKQFYKVKITPQEVAGIPVLVYEPASGVAADMRDKVLLNVHGGGFSGCFIECGGLESIPVAALTGGRVISIDYRQGPTNFFPAASEDVATVYREVIKTTPASRIALFGCSAGGTLTSQSLAWFQKKGLPTPAAAGIFCSGATKPGVRGDSTIIGELLGDANAPNARPAQPVAPAAAAPPRGEYMSTARLDDPMAYPGIDQEILAKFPPTLVVVGARDFALSAAIHMHSTLVANGVDARLHVWEGGRHAFFYDSSVPESREAHAVMAAFFKQRLK